MDLLITKIKEHKRLVIFALLFTVILIYCHFNTFISNDDLSYSFLYRGETRVTNLIQVAKSQVADYLHLNGRFFVHCIVQTLLIFGKKLWSILNPIVILALILTITSIIKVLKHEKKISFEDFFESLHFIENFLL